MIRLTITQAAAAIGLSKATIRGWISSGRLIASAYEDRHGFRWEVTPADLEAARLSKPVKSTPEGRDELTKRKLRVAERRAEKAETSLHEMRGLLREVQRLVQHALNLDDPAFLEEALRMIELTRP
jgi:hypothetical protein